MKEEKNIRKGGKYALLAAILLVMGGLKVMGQSIKEPSSSLSTQNLLLDSEFLNDTLKVKSKMDSLEWFRRQRVKLDSLGKLPLGVMEMAEAKVDSLSLKIDKKLTIKKDKAKKKISIFHKKVHDKTSINTEQAQSNLMGSKLGGNNETTEKLHTIKSEVAAAKEKVGGLNLNRVEKLEELRSLKDAQLLSRSESLVEDSEIFKRINGLTSDTFRGKESDLNLGKEKLFNNLSKAKKYKEDLSELKEGNLDKIDIERALEQKVQSLEGVADLEAKKSALTPQLEGYKTLFPPQSLS